jgi:uncharacterized protein
MSFEVIGRSSKKTAKLQRDFALTIGKDNYKNEVLLDIYSSQIILVCGKRGTGKSYGLGVFAEEFDNLDKEIKKDYSVIYIDPMGIFWTMNYANTKKEETELLKKENIIPKRVNADFYITEGYYKELITDDQLDFFIPISFLPSEVSAGNWCNTFDFDENKPQGIAIARAIKKLKSKNLNYTIMDIISTIKSDTSNGQTTIDSLENRFMAAIEWGIFSNKGFKFTDLIKPGKISIIDLSGIRNTGNNWGIRSLIVSLIADNIMKEKMFVRRKKEISRILKQTQDDEFSPNTWFVIDEAHNFLPKIGNFSSKESLRTLILEGRNPGISMVVATQQPGSLLPDVLSQCDIIISHHLTKKEDIDALNGIMQTYQKKEIKSYLKEISKDNPGQAIVLDNVSENITMVNIRPRQSWHGGGSPNEDKGNSTSKNEDLSFLEKD